MLGLNEQKHQTSHATLLSLFKWQDGRLGGCRRKEIDKSRRYIWCFLIMSYLNMYFLNFGVLPDTLFVYFVTTQEAVNQS
jgi:hypothetical protein